MMADSLVALGQLMAKYYLQLDTMLIIKDMGRNLDLERLVSYELDKSAYSSTMPFSCLCWHAQRNLWNFHFILEKRAFLILSKKIRLFDFLLKAALKR
jgi:hypothetical protein